MQITGSSFSVCFNNEFVREYGMLGNLVSCDSNATCVAIGNLIRWRRGWCCFVSEGAGCVRFSVHSRAA